MARYTAKCYQNTVEKAWCDCRAGGRGAQGVADCRNLPCIGKKYKEKSPTLIHGQYVDYAP